MKSGILRSVAVAAILMLSVIACSTGIGAANQDEPAGAVKGAFEAAQAGGFAKLADFACAAKKDEISTLFGPGGSVGALGSLGLSPDDLFGAMKVEFKDIQTTEKSKTGDNAVVHLTGTMSISLDAAKMRDLMKKALTAAGQPADDKTLDALMATTAGFGGQSRPIDDDIAVVKEGGKWVMCG